MSTSAWKRHAWKLRPRRRPSFCRRVVPRYPTQVFKDLRLLGAMICTDPRVLNKPVDHEDLVVLVRTRNGAKGPFDGLDHLITTLGLLGRNRKLKQGSMWLARRGPEPSSVSLND